MNKVEGTLRCIKQYGNRDFAKNFYLEVSRHEMCQKIHLNFILARFTAATILLYLSENRELLKETKASFPNKILAFLLY